MYEFHYDYMKCKYAGDKLELCYMDTDSLIYLIETNDFSAHIADNVESRFDTSGLYSIYIIGLKKSNKTWIYHYTRQVFAMLSVG